jgi:hypothetical protein
MVQLMLSVRLPLDEKLPGLRLSLCEFLQKLP